MFKWLGVIKFWKQREPEGPVVREYGRYVHKPVMARALSVVLEQDQAVIAAWVADPDIHIFVNGEELQGSKWALGRMESGDYEIKISTEEDKVWLFFIG